MSATIDNVAKTFREAGLDDPLLENNGKKYLKLQRQLKGYVDLDPATAKQSCIPLQVFSTLLSNSTSPSQLATAQLTVGALFFAMRSCEYSHTDGDTCENNKRKTKILRLRNIKFYQGNEELDIYNDQDILFASSIIVTFEFQKDRNKFESIKQDASGESLCPVKIWALIVLRII